MSNGLRWASARSRWSERDAQAVLERWRRSGLTLAGFAAEQGLDAQRLYRWRRRLERSTAVTVETAPVFVEVMPVVPGTRRAASGGGGAEPFEVVLSSGRVVRVPAGFEGDALRRLLAIVDEGARC